MTNKMSGPFHNKPEQDEPPGYSKNSQPSTLEEGGVLSNYFHSGRKSQI